MLSLQNWKEHLKNVTSLQDLEDLKSKLLGKSGLLTAEMKQLGSLSLEEKREKGQELNNIRDEIQSSLEDKKNVFEEALLNEKINAEAIDLTLPSRPLKVGKTHILSQVMDDIKTYFTSLGFEFKTAPDIETEENNFDALNIPNFHPARQSQDTFYIDGQEREINRFLVRTHTSNAQIHTLKSCKPPLRSFTIGRAYRNDAIDATHTPMFHQLELIAVDETITMAHLKTTIVDFLKFFFNQKDLQVRFRPSFFPFTSPSAEVDIMMKGRGWLEILGCGLIHPNVLTNCGIDSNIYNGFAAGMGIERLTMLKYGIKDIRHFFENDQRFLNTFGS
ncbi:MAG: phenylalanine--tRNA ligase subunit alpha [Proteobacteria bacterium]|nr:phenylalanine--tRNA ligase subunit alpha [Pseudomonadota bacterium]